jgi:hypothetical protein
MKKSRKLACHVVSLNIAICSLPTLQISLVIVPLFEKIYNGEPILSVVSNIGEDVQYRCFNYSKCMMRKVCRSPTQCLYLETILDCQGQKQALLSNFMPLT